MSLRILTFEYHDPRLNLAFEEALARARAGDLIPDTLRIWINNNALVLGYFREAREDINMLKAKKEEFPIIRRFTGGGTVYHDKGCINYTITLKRNVRFPISYLYGILLKGTIEALKIFGVNPELRNTSDVVLGERKISGTAGSIKWGVLFLHGSILINADLKKLTSLLRVPEEIKPSVDPVKYRVANLSEFIDVNQKDVIESIIHGYSKILSCGYYIDKPTKEEKKLARLLYREKYSKKEWNLERPPKINRKELEDKVRELLG